MTRNQISYWQHVEQSRHNRATEKLQHEANEITIRGQDLTYKINLLNLQETERSNRAREAELNRHNLATEAQGMRNLEIQQQEANTHAYQAAIQERNAATQAYLANIEAGKLNELERSNRAREFENMRSNMASETISALNVATRFQVDQYNAETGRINAETGIGTLQENTRHNMAYEAETNRHNMAVETETRRDNIYSQQLRAAELQQQINYQTGTLQLESLKLGQNAVKSFMTLNPMKK